MTRLNYGDDPEFDAYIESRIDPEWTGSESDHFGWQSNREQTRWERDRGAASLLAVCACLIVAVSFAPEWWQRCFIAALFAFGLGCWLMIRGTQRGAAIRDRLDAEAPKVGGRS